MSISFPWQACAGREAGPCYQDYGLPSPVLASYLAELFEDVHRLRHEGNTAFRGGRFAAAAERYGEALLKGGGCGSKAAAVLHSNRAAAYLSQGQLLDALLDALRARVLDPSYARNNARLASIMVQAGRHQAAADLIRDLGSAERHDPKLLALEKECGLRARFDCPPDHARLLGTAAVAPEALSRHCRRCLWSCHPDRALGAAGGKLPLEAAGGEASGPHAKVRALVSGLLGRTSAHESELTEACTELFKWVSQAVEVVSDEAKREAHQRKQQTTEAAYRRASRPMPPPRSYVPGRSSSFWGQSSDGYHWTHSRSGSRGSRSHWFYMDPSDNGTDDDDGEEFATYFG